MITIGNKIVKSEVATIEIKENISMNETIKRPDSLKGTTYKIKPPISEHAFYITINDMVLDGKSHPYEIFINSKNMEHYQFITALTRIISAVFRKGGEIGFLVEELKAVFDPRGGYFQAGGKFIPSLIAEIGSVIERHLGIPAAIPESNNKLLCSKCSHKAVVILNGCKTCLNCGDSKCD